MAEHSKDAQSNDSTEPLRIAIIGAGTIGLSFAALHLSHRPNTLVTIYDPRADLKSYIYENLSSSSPTPLAQDEITRLFTTNRLTIAESLPSAVSNAHIIQEQGPESPTFKQTIWADIEFHAPLNAPFWSSTSGIPASIQSMNMTPAGQRRLLVVHPYNPPHIMPLLEIVPSPSTDPDVLARTVAYWSDPNLKKVPVVIREEVTGFVANRLAFALLREAIQLVDEEVVAPDELDRIVENSMGPRWMLAGPFRSYHAGGGEGGLRDFLKNIGGTVQGCWEDGGRVNVGKGEEWEERVCGEVERVYGKGIKREEVEGRSKAMKQLLDLRRELTEEG